MGWYQYSSIDPECPSIRLIRLIHGEDEPIRCELFNAWLYDEAIEYDALSYTWGGTEKPCEIEIEGASLPVTENLFLALQHLRYPLQDRILWIDAISIDQENDKERGHQVDQMGQVYSQAEQVVIWLGHSSLATEVLMDSLKSLQSEHNRSGGQNWIPSDPRWLEVWLKVQPDLRMKHFDLENLQRKGLQTLLERPWFKRVWILQEVAKSRRAIVQAGSHSISARIFALAPLLVGASVQGHTQAVLDIMPGPSRKNSWWSHKQDFYTLLARFKDSEATDERDMVYALLGISSDQESHGFLADYTMTTDDLIRKVCFYLFGNLASQTPFNSSMSTFLHNFAQLNATAFYDGAKSWTVEDADKFLDERGDEMVIIEALTEIVALNPQHGAEITKLLYTRLGQKQSANTNPYKGHPKPDLLLDKTVKVMESHLLKLIATADTRFILLLLESQGWDGKITLRLVQALANPKNAKTDMLEFLLWHPKARFTVTEELVAEVARSFRTSALQALLNQSEKKITVTSKVIQAAYINRDYGNDIMKRLIESPAAYFEVSEVVIVGMVACFDASIVHAFLSHLGREYRVTDKVVTAAQNNTEHSDQVEPLILQYQEWGYVHQNFWCWEIFQSLEGKEFRSLVDVKIKLKKVGAASPDIERRLVKLEQLYLHPYRGDRLSFT